MSSKTNHLIFWLVSLAGFLFDQITKAAVCKHLLQANKVLWMPLPEWLDQITKALGFNDLYPGQMREVLPGIFRLKPLMQTGMAWGFFRGYNLALTIVSAAAIITLIVIFLLNAPRLAGQTTLALALITAGASGNLSDRLFVGQVRDFLDFYLIRWPIFNIADVLICVGAGLMIWTILRESKATQE